MATEMLQLTERKMVERWLEVATCNGGSLEREGMKIKKIKLKRCIKLRYYMMSFLCLYFCVHLSFLNV